MPTLTHVDRAVGEAAIFAAIEKDGAVIVDDFLAPELLRALRNDVLPHVGDHSPGAQGGHEFWRSFHGAATKRLTGVAEMSRRWGELLCDPLYRALGDYYLGADNYYLNTGQLICIGPGESEQMLHRDELNWPAAVSDDHETTVTAIFALTEFTRENGATVVAPGSHRWPGALPAVSPSQCCQAEMPAGAALLYNGKVIHGGGANRSADQWRIGLHAGFVLGWLRAEENHQLTTSLETARALPEHAQRMLGFRSYQPPKAARLGLVNYEDAGVLLS